MLLGAFVPGVEAGGVGADFLQPGGDLIPDLCGSDLVGVQTFDPIGNI